MQDLHYTSDVVTRSVAPVAAPEVAVEASPVLLKEDFPMSDTKSDSNSAWGPLAAGVAGLLLGENGVLGKGNNSGNAVTPDQLGTALGNLQGTSQRERLSDQINLLGAGNAIGFGAVKDAVTSAASQNALSLCALSGSITQGFAQTNFNIQAQGAASRELALQQALDAERTRATELRIALSETKNQAGHTATQVLLQQIVNLPKPTAAV